MNIIRLIHDFDFKVVVKAVRELGEREGSSLKSIEKYLRQSHTVLETTEHDLKTYLRLATKRAVARNLILQDGKCFKYSFKAKLSPQGKKRKNVDDDEIVPKVSLFFEYLIINLIDDLHFLILNISLKNL